MLFFWHGKWSTLVELCPQMEAFLPSFSHGISLCCLVTFVTAHRLLQLIHVLNIGLNVSRTGKIPTHKVARPWRSCSGRLWQQRWMEMASLQYPAEVISSQNPRSDSLGSVWFDHRELADFESIATSWWHHICFSARNDVTWLHFALPIFHAAYLSSSEDQGGLAEGFLLEAVEWHLGPHMQSCIK